MVKTSTPTAPERANLLAIGDVAEMTGLAVSAIRYYDEIGLIHSESRVGGPRQFSKPTVGRIRFTQRCQEAGFSLAEIRQILDDTTGAWRGLVDTRVLELVAERDRLDQVIQAFRSIPGCGCDVVAECDRRELQI